CAKGGGYYSGDSVAFDFW
nr:immunoglobulin heavy chain junction region [Macaca mulatta]